MLKTRLYAAVAHKNIFTHENVCIYGAAQYSQQYTTDESPRKGRQIWVLTYDGVNERGDRTALAISAAGSTAKS